MERRRLKPRKKRYGFLLAALFACLYMATAQRGIAWQDSGILQIRVLFGDLTWRIGLASAHPLYIQAARAFARFALDPANPRLPFVINCFSGLCAALSVAVLYRIAAELTSSRKAAALAATAYGLAHMPWWLATIAESYHLSALLIGAETLTAIKVLKRGPSLRLTLAAGIFAGFGFATHNLSLISLPFLLAVILVRAAPHGHGSLLRHLFYFATPWFLCSELYVKWFHSEPMSFEGFVSDVLFGDYRAEVTGAATAPAGITAANLAIMSLSLLSPCWAAGLAAVARHLRHPRRAAAAIRARFSAPVAYVAALLVVHSAFLLHYRIADQALFLLPSLLLASALLAIPLTGIRSPRKLAAATAACAVAVPIAVNAVLHLPPLAARINATRARLLPGRDEIRYWAIPWKFDENSADAFATAAIAFLETTPGASVFADSTSAPPLEFKSTFSTSTDWTLYTPWSDTSRLLSDCRSGKPCFAVSPIQGYCPAAALATGKVRPLPLPASGK